MYKRQRIDILLPIEEGGRFRLGSITFTGNKQINNVKALRATFPIKDGDWFNATMVSKGLENLKKAYGSLGYINFGAIPKLVPDEKSKTVSLDIDIDEGKQFYVSRIEFEGNTITRDRVIRRELMLDEGSVYNSQLWEFSLLRLNQLEYFDPLKVDQDSEAHQDPDAGTVELLLKVKEKGKNSIGMNGGISGLSGAFIGVNYQTNNFLGLGETLSVQANLGSISRQFTFGFTQDVYKRQPSHTGLHSACARQVRGSHSHWGQPPEYRWATKVRSSKSASRCPPAAHRTLRRDNCGPAPRAACPRRLPWDGASSSTAPGCRHPKVPPAPRSSRPGSAPVSYTHLSVPW